MCNCFFYTVNSFACYCSNFVLVISSCCYSVAFIRINCVCTVSFCSKCTSAIFCYSNSTVTCFVDCQFMSGINSQCNSRCYIFTACRCESISLTSVCTCNTVYCPCITCCMSNSRCSQSVCSTLCQCNSCACCNSRA
ncbi:unknown [Firmicutes bacterium CAG:41]|nr:unknown [Firmicutes bacterium CAG:41]